MSYFVIFIVCIALILFVAGQVIIGIGKVVKVAKSSGNAIAGTARGSSSAIVDWLGRKRWQREALVPSELIDGADPLPGLDSERRDLARYDPQPSLPPPVGYTLFKNEVDVVFGDWEAPAIEIDVERTSDILSVSSSRSFDGLFNLAEQISTYPRRPPSSPQNIPAPPSWTVWCPTFNEPTFDPPYYSGKLAILNRYVDIVYRGEMEKVERASQRKAGLLEACRKRNSEVDALAKLAVKNREAATARQVAAFDMAAAKHNDYARAFEAAFRKQQETLVRWIANAQDPSAAGFIFRIDLAMRTMALPPFVSREGQSRFDAESGVLIHEHRFPDLSAAEWTKQIQLKSGWVTKAANQKEKKDAAMRSYPSICLRLAAEIARLDDSGFLKAVVINGWADYTEKATGQGKRAYCASLFATKEQMLGLNLSALDPLAAFAALKGITAHSLEVTPIAPILRLDMNDPRFIDPRVVLANLSEGENLAAMDWGDFEHLCRELFERAFAVSGAQVKVTQASRDKGVDAVIFDPDPLRGGKIVVQAKRYTNTVDVSAVRDLYGAVINEGAIKGILVTTSHYGPDSYSFAKDKPLTLLNGRELLGLLEVHGYKFRIDLAEAKGML